MTMTSTVSAAGSAPRTGSFIATIRQALVRRAMIRRTIAELSKMSDHELNDIGISRGDIRRVAVESAEG